MFKSQATGFNILNPVASNEKIMTKKFILCLKIIFLCYSNVFCQNFASEIANYKASYKFGHQLDSNNKKSLYYEDMAVFIGNKNSVFISLENIEREKIIEKQKKEMLRTNNFTFTSVKKAIESEFFHENSTNIFLVKQRLVEQDYLMKDEVKNITWKILNEQKDILKFKCQKAVANFRGRFYTVWFTKDVPVSNGPWKLFGLPGLIVKAEDLKQEITFELFEFEKVPITENFFIKLPINSIYVKRQEWDKLKNEYDNNPLVFIQQSAESHGLKLNIKVDNAEIQSNRKKKVTNPLELNYN